jgi:S-adenosylmethionine hydrolase
MTFMAHVGSTDRLELAIVDENASAMLGVTVGAPVCVSW